LTLSRELASELSYLEQEAASVLVDGVIEELKEKYPGADVSEYLEEVRHHLLDNLDPFKEREGEGEHDEEPPDGLPKMTGGRKRAETGSHLHQCEGHSDRRPRAVRDAVRVRRRFPQDFQSPRRVR